MVQLDQIIRLLCQGFSINQWRANQLDKNEEGFKVGGSVLPFSLSVGSGVSCSDDDRGYIE